ncbi:hypothetical protein [Clostridium perfringens]|nr:hypothetical protein [Clostridium perfringens]
MIQSMDCINQKALLKEIHGYSRIQNANNPSDVQNMPNGVNAMLTVNA